MIDVELWNWRAGTCTTGLALCWCTCFWRGIWYPFHNLNFRNFVNDDWHLWGLSSEKNCDQSVMASFIFHNEGINEGQDTAGYGARFSSSTRSWTTLFVLSARVRPLAFLFYPKRQCRRSASLLFWVKFISTSGVSSSFDMVGMRTVMSFALCSPGSPSLTPPRSCSPPPLTPHLIQYPGYHGDLIIRASIALGPSEGASLIHTLLSK